MQNGWLKVPEHDLAWEGKPVKVIVLLQAEKQEMSTTTRDDIFGCVDYKGAPKSLEESDSDKKKPKEIICSY